MSSSLSVSHTSGDQSSGVMCSVEELAGSLVEGTTYLDADVVDFINEVFWDLV